MTWWVLYQHLTSPLYIRRVLQHHTATKLWLKPCKSFFGYHKLKYFSHVFRKKWCSLKCGKFLKWLRVSPSPPIAGKLRGFWSSMAIINGLSITSARFPECCQLWHYQRCHSNKKTSSRKCLNSLRQLWDWHISYSCMTISCPSAPIWMLFLKVGAVLNHRDRRNHRALLYITTMILVQANIFFKKLEALTRVRTFLP